MFSHTFQVAPTPKALQFIPYDGPPKPKQTPRSVPLKTPSNEDEWPSIDDVLEFWAKERNLAPTSHGDDVVDFTCLAGEGNSEISDSGGASDDGCPLTTEWKGVRSTPVISMRTSRDTVEENSNQPAPSGGSSEENAIIIESEPSDTDIDENDLYKDNEVPAILSLSDREFATCTGDGIKLVAGGKKSQVSGLPDRKDLPTSPASSPITIIEQPTQKANEHNLLKAFAPKPHQPMQKEVERERRPFMVETTSSSSEADDHDSSNQVTWLTRKRKFSLVKKHIHTSSKASKRRSRFPRKLPSERSSAMKTPPAAQYTSSGSKRCYSGESNNDGSEDNDDCDHHLRNNKRPKLTSYSRHSRHSRKRKQGLTCGSADNDDNEYEVEEILDVRINRRKLQYRVKWLGYEDDPEWYDASNFKNSPYKLRDFHAANATLPGPPKRLNIWAQCWEEDEDAGVHSDDNKPEKYTREEITGMPGV